MNHDRFFALDGLRGIAAIAVVLFHLGLWTLHPGFFAHGYLAVDFFFCLSGFVVAFAYDERLNTTMTPAGFVRVRIERLYPIIVLGMILGAVVPLARAFGGHHAPISFRDVAEALVFGVLMIPRVWASSPISPGIYPLNTPFWSLLFEFVANFAWVFGARRLPAWWLYVLSSIAGVALFAARSSCDLGVVDAGQLIYGLARVALGFSAGLMVYDVFRAGKCSWLSGVPLAPLLATLIVVMTLPPLGVWYDLACAILVFPVLTLLGARAVISPRAKPVLAWFGDISYPLYGVHRPVIYTILVLATGIRHGAKPDFPTAVVAFSFAIVAGHMASRYFDRPVHRAIALMKLR